MSIAPTCVFSVTSQQPHNNNMTYSLIQPSDEP